MTMKHIEEIESGECFKYKNHNYIATFDYNNNNKRLCVELSNGTLRWLDQNYLVDSQQIYFLDQDNNIVSIRKSNDKKNT